LEVQIEATENLFSDEMKEMEEIERNIANQIKKEIGLRVDVTLVESESLPRSEGKAARVIDKRDFS